MRRGAAARCLLLTAALATPVGRCATQETPAADKDPALAARIEQLLDAFLTSDDSARQASVLDEARVIFEREGIPSEASVGADAAYGFVLINMLGQTPDFRRQFVARIQDEASRQALRINSTSRRLTTRRTSTCGAPSWD